MALVTHHYLRSNDPIMSEYDSLRLPITMGNNGMMMHGNNNPLTSFFLGGTSRIEGVGLTTISKTNSSSLVDLAKILGSGEILSRQNLQ